jgi:hypothetical protein
MEAQGDEGVYGCIQSPMISHFSYMSYVGDKNIEGLVKDALSYAAWKNVN